MQTEQKQEKKPRSGVMLLLFALLPLTCISIAIAVPMLSAFSGLQEVRKLAESKPVVFEYKKNKTFYKKILGLIEKFIKTKQKAQLQLSVEELNLLIGNHPMLSRVKGKFKVKELLPAVHNQGAILRADMSLPLNEVLHEPNLYLNEQVDLLAHISHKTLIRSQEVLLRLVQIYNDEEALNLELVNVWGEKNLIDLWIDTLFSESESIKEKFNRIIKHISFSNKKLILRNYEDEK